MDNSLSFKRGLHDGIPIALGYFAVSLAFGVTAVGRGMPWFVATLMSTTNLTSAGQLAGLGIIMAMGTVAEIILTQLIINSRYCLMSLTLSQRLDGKFRLTDRLLCSFGITDEIFAVASAQKTPVTRKYMYGLILLPWISWTSGTLVGALIGNVLPEIVMSALGIALYAMFIAIIIPAAMNDSHVIPVMLISIGISCALTFIPYLNRIGEGFVYIIAALVSAAIGAYFFPVSENEDKGESADE